MLQNAYLEDSYKETTKQIQRLYNDNLKLFDKVLLRSEIDRFARSQEAKLDGKEAFQAASFTYVMPGQQLIGYQV